MPKDKAQMSAPFELLVAVIIMGFVILFGMNALSELNKQQCSKELQKTMQALINATELATNQSSAQSLAVNLPGCYSKAKLYFRTSGEESVCSHYCIGYRQNCVLLAFESPENSDIKCVNISYFTNFPESSDSGCPQRENYVLANPNQEISSGFYLIQNVTPIGQFTPTVCFYRQGKK